MAIIYRVKVKAVRRFERDAWTFSFLVVAGGIAIAERKALTAAKKSELRVVRTLSVKEVGQRDG